MRVDGNQPKSIWQALLSILGVRDMFLSDEALDEKFL